MGTAITRRTALKYGAAATATAAMVGRGVASAPAAHADDVAAPTDGGAATLTVHYYRARGGHRVTPHAFTLQGHDGHVVSTRHDDDWFTTTFSFPGHGSARYLGFAITRDSAFPGQKRFVQTNGGVAEVWLVAGDSQVYAEPQQIDSSLIVSEDRQSYVAVEDLSGPLSLTHHRAPNGYLFDQNPVRTAPILTIYHGRDYFEIDTDTNRIGQNVTGNMLRDYTDTVFTDVDGFQRGDKYYLSLAYIRRLFQVGTLQTDRSTYLLARQFVAYDRLLPAHDPALVGFSREALDDIDSYVQHQVDIGGPSLAVSVVKSGKIVKQSAYGYALKYHTSLVDGSYQAAHLLPEDERELARVDTLYDLASNTKMYATNYAIQQLVSQGKLDITRTVQSFPGWENFTDSSTEYTGDWTVGGPGGITSKHTGKSTVTVQDLLHHMAGQIPDPQYQNRNVAGDLYYHNSDIHDRSGIIDVICRTPLMAQPRTEFLYSDVDFMILGILVEQITGQSLDEYMHQNFYRPLGLRETTFNPLQHGHDEDDCAATENNGNTRDGNVSFGTLPDGTPVPIRRYTLQGQVQDEKSWYCMGGVSGHAGLFSTVGDLAVLTQVMLNGGIYGGREYFTKQVADQFTTPFALPGHNADYSTIGLGWRVHSKRSAAYYYFNWGPSRSTYGHEGWTGTLTIIDPTYDMTITILTNMRHSPVVDPPNGFWDSRFPIATMVPVTAHIYNALLDGTDESRRHHGHGR